MVTAKSLAAYIVSIIAAEATLLYGIGINELSQINLGILLQMLITFASVTLPWLGYSPKDVPIGAPKSEGGNSKVLIPLLVISLALALYACPGKQVDLKEGAIYNQLKNIETGYNFAHTSIVKFSEIVAAQKQMSCPSDPGGPLCKGALLYEKLYREKLYPASIKADEYWQQLTAAFDEYRKIEVPTDGDAQKVFDLILAVQKIIDELKGIFAGVQFSAEYEHIPYDVLESAWNYTEGIKAEVATRYMITHAGRAPQNVCGECVEVSH